MAPLPPGSVPSLPLPDPEPPEPPRVASGSLRRILVVPDAHIPYHAPKALALVREVAQQFRPNILVVIGDWGDCYCVSSFDKDPERKRFLRDELEECRVEMRALVEASRAERVVICEGNHEARIKKLLTKVPALHGLVSFPEYLGIQQNGWEWVPYKTSVRIGKMNYTHDVGRYGVNATRATLQDSGTCVTFGHTHRLAEHYEGNHREGTRVCLNVGWLGDPAAADYQHIDKVRRESQHGLGIQYQDQDGVTFSHAVPFVNGACEIEGRRVYV